MAELRGCRVLSVPELPSGDDVHRSLLHCVMDLAAAAGAGAGGRQAGDEDEGGMGVSVSGSELEGGPTGEE